LGCGVWWRDVVDLGFSVDAWEWHFRRRESLSVCLDYGVEREREMKGILYVYMTNLPSRKYVEALGIAFRQANVVNIRTTAVIHSCKRESMLRKNVHKMESHRLVEVLNIKRG